MSSGEGRQTPPPGYPGESGSSSSSSRNPQHNPDEKPPRQATAETTIETTGRAIIDPADPLSEIHRVSTSSSRLHRVGTNFSSYSMNKGGHFSSRRDHSPDHHVDDVPPPAYSDSGNYKSVSIQDDGFSSKAEVLDDGRIDIRINQRSRRLSNLLLPALQQQLTITQQPELATPTEPSSLLVPPGMQGKDIPRMNLVFQIIGSRGDIQPFIALGLKLHKNPPYHRVRIATHPVFKDFVQDSGLEFFSAGGDPAELMAFMVKNPGLVPGLESLKQGEVGKRRKAMYEMLGGFWRSCIEVGDGMTTIGTAVPEPFEQGKEDVFVADAIIANPPSFAHIHCAEKLGIPLHLMFTMPWTPTQSFPHPLANIRSSNTDANITNFLSYTLVEMLTWQGLGDLVNKFREKTLGLEPVSMMWAPGMISRLKVPQTYCWSPALIPKPKDWGSHIRISGFYFLDLANNYTPPQDLADFLAAGEPPVYIGFGSIVVDDPNALTKMIFDAVRKTGVRALVSKGWGGLGSEDLEVPEGVFMLGNCPHDWLFKHVACVVHHGGAGTTAIGVAMGKPTVIVPFFGDQPFWGSMVARAGAGPEPTPFKQMTADILAASIQTALTPEAQSSAEVIASKIRQENGAQNGADSFHMSLASIRMNCMADPTRAAVWRVKRTEVRLSALAAATLVENNLLEFTDLKLVRHKEWDTDDGPIEPISGATSALLGTFGSVMMGVGDFPREIFKAFKHQEARKLASGANTPSSGTPAPSQAGGSANGSSKTSLSEPSLTGSKTNGSSGRSSPVGDDLTASTVSKTNSHANSIAGSEASLVTSNTSLDSLPLGASASRDSLSKDSLSPIPTPRDSMTKEILGSALGASSSQTPPSPTDSGNVTPTGASFRGRMSAMATAMSMSRSRSRSQSPSGLERHGSGRNKLHKHKPEVKRHDSEDSGTKTPSQAGAVSLDMVVGAGKGAGRIAEALLRSPMDFTVSIAQGFHNAPKLYGDEVRKTEKITGIQSGLKVAGKEFAFGLYDGITGLVTQPVKGAQEHGVSGLFKGIGKGFGGVVLKPSAAVMGLHGYTFKGIYEEIKKMRGNDTNNYILAARTAQGYHEYSQTSQAERDMIIKRWNALGVERVKRRKGKEKEKEKEKEKRRASKEEEKEKHRTKSWKPQCERRGKKAASFAPESPTVSTPDVSTDALQEKWAQSERQGYLTQHRIFPNADEHVMNEAVEQAVNQTSRGDPEEDELIRQAIRASISEIQQSTADTHADEQAMMDRAIRASISAAGGKAGGEQDEELKKAIEESMKSHGERLVRTNSQTSSQSSTSSWVKPKPPMLPPRQSFQSSMTSTTAETESDDEDDDLKLALRQSAHEEEARLQKEKEEEDLILNYVKKASLQETQYKEQHEQRQQQETAAVEEGSGSAASASTAGPAATKPPLQKTDSEEQEEREIAQAIERSMTEK